MSSFALWIVIAVWVSNVQAKNETLTHGWRAEPNGRGTWSILWSCLATIFICTWSALHLNVPKRHGRWYLFFRKIRYMLIAVMAPELFLADSAANLFLARDLLKRISKEGNQEWTLTHMQFAIADGFCTRTPEGDKVICDIAQLEKLIIKKSIDGPPITEEELQARGKSDSVVKLIALLQIIWFAVQTLFRGIQHYQITALEIMTVAFVFCTVFTYATCWYQPQDVEFPVFLEIDDVAPATDGTTPDQNRDRSSHAEEDAGTPTRWPGRVQTDPLDTYVSGRVAENVQDILVTLFACGFGALHCLAWNSPFPTYKERLAWRICSVTTTVLPAPFTLLLLYMDRYDRGDIVGNRLLGAILLITVLYTLGRATIVVLAFTALRTLPADAFQTVDWNRYLPHFAG